MCCGNNETEWDWGKSMTPDMRALQEMLIGRASNNLTNSRSGGSPAYTGAINATASPLTVQASNVMSGMMGYPPKGTGYGVPLRPGTGSGSKTASTTGGTGNTASTTNTGGSTVRPPEYTGGDFSAEPPRAGSELMALMQMLMSQNRYKSS